MAKAISEPEKVMAPITSPKVFIMYCVEKLSCSDKEIQTAERPPKELNTAIIWGKAVIFTFCPE